jgi:hypothetical protein
MGKAVIKFKKFGRNNALKMPARCPQKCPQKCRQKCPQNAHKNENRLIDLCIILP